jgi:hypothetical protein
MVLMDQSLRSVISWTVTVMDSLMKALETAVGSVVNPTQRPVMVLIKTAMEM